MTRYEQGFMNKLAAGLSTGHVNGLGIDAGGASLGGLHAGYATGHGINTIGVGSRNGGFSASLSNAAIHNGLLGAGLGAAAGVTREALRDPEYRKHYLKSILIGLLAGGAVGIGATMAGNLPDYTRKVLG